jgi:hypothetical protein
MAYTKPEIPELRRFGITFAVFFSLVFGLVIPLVSRGWIHFSELSNGPAWPYAVSLLIILWALINPGSLHLLHRPWMAFAQVAGWLNTRLIMLILFYFIVFPVGLIMRIFGYDPMHGKIDKNVRSYRVRSKARNREHMERPY